MDKKRIPKRKKVIPFIPDGEFFYKKAIAAMRRDQYEDAYKYLKRAVELSPDDPYILMQFGVLVMEEGEFDEAQEIFLKVYSLNDSITENIFYLAEVHAHLDHLSEAKAFAEKYLRLESQGSFIDEAKEIIDFVEQSSQYLPDEDYEVYLLQEQARRLMEIGNFQEAVDVLESIITDYPQLWAAYNNLALAYFYVGESKKAYEILFDVLENNKGNLHALCNLAVFYYYEKKEKELAQLVKMLVKMKPYLIEHRYKLGATMALIGKHEVAFQLFRQLQKSGYDGDTGFYFWYAHSAYFTGHKSIAKQAYDHLLAIDQTKEGFEPWKDVEKQVHFDSVEQDRTFILNKIQNDYRSERMFGFFLLGKSAHKQEILSHPSYIHTNELTKKEKLFLSTMLETEFALQEVFDKHYIRALETTEVLYDNYRPLNYEAAHLFQMWFTLCEEALKEDYHFRNPNALAAAVDYMFQSARYERVTKVAIAKKYYISPPTLTKYVNDLIAFLPYK